MLDIEILDELLDEYTGAEIIIEFENGNLQVHQSIYDGRIQVNIDANNQLGRFIACRIHNVSDL